MKKIFLILLSFSLYLNGFSQNVEMDKTNALSLVKNNYKYLGFPAKEINNLSVSQSYSNKETGVSYVYLRQTFEGIPIHNKIIVLAYKGNKLVSKAGDIFLNPELYPTTKFTTPAFTAASAIVAAAIDLKAGTASSFPITKELNGKYNFGLLNIAYEDITAELFWLPVEKVGSKTTLRLVWQILLSPIHTDDMWYVRVDAQNNEVINKTNLTVFEKLEEHTSHNNEENHPFISNDNKLSRVVKSNNPSLVGTANYLVIPYPVESPLYGAAANVTNPWNLAAASNPNASSLGWHNDGAVDYTITRGNNAWATEDRAASNTNTGLPATSTTSPDPLTFNFTPDYTLAPTDPTFQRFATTNLFYWNNIVHDISYNYGFNEVSGNFQASNQGRGGAGGDHVIALAQSGAGNNNANFSTPPDGSRPRMRMYLWTAPNPDRDGDLDAGIVAHEYTHGISNRLTGGIAGGGGCLGNAEQGGEGWSDYFALMMTTNWATAQTTDGGLRRPIGNYVLAQSTAGVGIRSRPYSTNFSINNLTYSYVASSGGQVHSIGEVWCSAIWDMTWDMIQLDGINPNLFNASAVGGNSAALRLVTEGMKLQPCSPGFIDARNAILAADSLVYAGRYHCIIINAFARRGMGTDASQGSSNSTSDQIVGFSNQETRLTLTQSVTQQQEGLFVTYTNKVTAGPCGGITNFLLTDTLPSNVTYVSGGSYNATTRVVSFPVSLAAGVSQNFPFTIQINAGTYFPTITLFEDEVTGATIPTAIWTNTSTTTTNWTLSNARSNTPPSSYYSLNTVNISDQRLFSTNGIALGATPPNLSFWHWFKTEGTYDGGVLEISTDNGTTYNDIGSGNFIKGGYTTGMDATTVLAGRQAWTGASGGFIKTIVNLTPFANQNIKLRFRSTTDNGTSFEGWYVDDIAIKKIAQVDISSNLFNASSIRVLITDTFTLIIPSACAQASITTQPAATTVCAGSTATFTVSASGLTPLTYQWQVSTTGVGGSFTNVGTNSPALTLTGVTTSMNNNVYRVIVSNTCPSTITSANAILTVQSTSAPAVTSPINYCQGATATPLTATGTSLLWYTASAGGTGSATAPTPNTSATATTIFYVSQTTSCGEGPRAAITVNVNAVPAAPTVTPTITYCQNATTATLSASGTALLWYTTATGGVGSATAPTPNTSTATVTTFYVSQTTNGCESPRASITVTVNATPAAPTATTTIAYCQGATATALSASGTNLLWYTTATGGTGNTTAFTPSTTSGGSTIYYVSQTTNGCEGPRTAITVNVTATPAAPTVTLTVTYCQNTTAVPLTATGTNLLWYTTATGGIGGTTAPTPSTTTLGNTNYYVSQTAGVGCEGPRALITVSVVASTPAPTVTSPVTYCQGSTAAALSASGTGLLWYGTNATGGTGSTAATIPSTTTSGTFLYYVSQTTSCGEGPRAAITVNITALPAAATATSPIAYCQGATAIALTATGTNLLWYGTNATGGTGSTTAPIPSTSIAGSFTYYVSQTASSCEGPRAGIVVNVTALPAAPAVISPLVYCQNNTATALTATGTNLKWYTVATSGTALATAPTPATTTIGSTTFYVSQSTGTCEGPRASIVVTVTAQTAAPTVASSVVYCQGSTAVALNATGTNLLWYTAATGGTGSATAPTPSTASVGTTTFYVSQTGTCESPRAAIVVTINPTPSAPTVISTVNYCQGGTATALTATGTSLLWYTVATGGTAGASTAPTPSTASVGSFIYYVSQTTSVCEGPRAAITVTIGAAPAITAQPQDITSCATTATFSVTATGTALTYQWQVSIDAGATYNNIAGANAESLTLTGLTTAQSNNKYRVIVSSASCPSATSNAVSAKVGTTPVVVLTASPATNFNPRINGGLFTTVSPPSTNYTYQWKRNNGIITNTSSSLTKTNGLLEEFGSYVVTVTDNTTGCFGVSNAITVNDIEGERNQLFISPNPTTGIIKVTYHSSITTSQARKINVYDAKGAQLMTKTFNVTGRYGSIDIDLSKLVAGTYTIVLLNANNNKLISENVVKY